MILSQFNLSTNGMIDKDTTLLVIGSSGERFAALTSRAVDATLLSPPFNLRAVSMGYRRFVNVSDYIKVPQAGWGTRDDKARKNPQEVLKMVRASLKGIKFVKAETEYMILKIMDIFRLNREDAARTLEVIQEDLNFSGYLSDSSEQSVVNLMKQTAKVTEDIPPTRIFDNRLAKQAEEELKGWKPQLPR